MFMRNAKLFQVSNLGPGVFPLFSDNAPQPANDPAVEGFENVLGFRQAVIVPPTFQVLTQSLYDLVQAFPTFAARQFPDRVAPSWENLRKSHTGVSSGTLAFAYLFPSPQGPGLDLHQLAG
jgi:hypothetical protein